MWREIWLYVGWNAKPLKRFKRWLHLLCYGMWWGHRAIDIKRRRRSVAIYCDCGKRF